MGDYSMHITKIAPFPGTTQRSAWEGCFLWQGMRDSNPRTRSQSPVCYRYTNPLYFGSKAEQRLLLYAKPAKCQEEISNFARKLFSCLLLRRDWEPGIVWCGKGCFIP